MIENEVRAHKLESTVVVVLRIDILKSLAFGCPQLKGGLVLSLLHGPGMHCGHIPHYQQAPQRTRTLVCAS